MDTCGKCAVLEKLARPLGYCFHEQCGFFSSAPDAWQREAGYTWFYDYMAPRFRMVFDCLPVYFDYGGRTWLIEFWKGQYGINAGAEIGIYHADRILSAQEYKTALFEAASDEEMLDCSFMLCGAADGCVQVSRKHWWLTAFFPGCFAQPSDLCMKSTIRFPNRRMQGAFADGLRKAGCTGQDFAAAGLGVTVQFSCAKARYTLRTRFWRCFSQWRNRISCRLFLRATRPFRCTLDRVLYLYYSLPFVFRRLLWLRRVPGRCRRRKCHFHGKCCKRGRL